MTISARESILVRQQEVLEPFALTVVRNRLDFDELELPAISILEGDEDADDGDPRRQRVGSAGSRRVRMTSGLLLALSEKTEAVGTALNELDASVRAAILNDVTLLNYTINGRSIRYNGMNSSLSESGRLLLGQRVLRFTFSYLFRA